MNAKTKETAPATVAPATVAVAAAPRKRGRIATKTLLTDATGAPNGVSFQWGDGAPTSSVRVTDYPEAVRTWLAVMGLSHTLGDAYSAATTPGEARGLWQKKHDALRNGDVRAQRGPGGPSLSDLIEALALVSGRSTEKASAVVVNMDEGARKALRTDPRIVTALKKIELARAEVALSNAPAADVDPIEAMFPDD